MIVEESTPRRGRGLNLSFCGMGSLARNFGPSGGGGWRRRRIEERSFCEDEAKLLYHREVLNIQEIPYVQGGGGMGYSRGADVGPGLVFVPWGKRETRDSPSPLYYIYNIYFAVYVYTYNIYICVYVCRYEASYSASLGTKKKLSYFHIYTREEA